MYEPGDVVLVNSVNNCRFEDGQSLYAIVTNPHPEMPLDSDWCFCAWVPRPNYDLEGRHCNGHALQLGWFFAASEVERLVPVDEVPNWVWSEYAKWQLLGDHADAS